MSASRRRRSAAAWCCSFSPPPASPDLKPPAKSPPPAHPNPSPNPNPNPNPRPGLGRRILSPGRVSPIDSITDSITIADPAPDPASIDEDPVNMREEGCTDLRIELKGRDGRGFVIEVEDRKLLCENSEFFKGLVESDSRIVEVDDVDLLREAVEMMCLCSERDLMRWIVNRGVSRAIDLLEVSSIIMFERGIKSCLRYIESAPWTESEEEKLKSIFSRLTFNDLITEDILSRLSPQSRVTASSAAGDLSILLIQQIANSTNSNSRKEMQSLVQGLLSKSSVYNKEPTSLNKDSLYRICHSCLDSLVEMLKESPSLNDSNTPLIERVSKQVENLNWLLEILVNNNVGEEFIDLWANQEELVKMHGKLSPMVRYELSRVSAFVFVALGKGKLQCPGEVRIRVFNLWFGPMLLDFGWLKRCPKGLDFRMLEENLGRALLTLPLIQQQKLFEEWFKCFAVRGTECPNLSRGFQVWWRRSFVRSVR